MLFRSIYRGQSGGPVFNGDGRVVGVIRSVSAETPVVDAAAKDDGAAVAVDLERLLRLLRTTNTDYDSDAKGLAKDDVMKADATPVARIDCWR